MKIFKIVAGVFLVYLGLVALLPGITGYWQPEWEGGVQIITTGSDGNERERVLAGYWVDDKLYVCSNYWLRGWYNHAVENPEVEVVVDGKRSAYTAVPVQGAASLELRRDAAEQPRGDPAAAENALHDGRRRDREHREQQRHARQYHAT